MGIDKELEKIINKIARDLLKKKENNKQSITRQVKPLERVKVVGVNSSHGVYVYNKKDRLWELILVDGDAFTPWKDGYWVIYFDNTKCPACRLYDLSWYVFVETIGRTMDDTEFIIILCDWFARECRSEAARKSFEKYDIHASPTTLLLKVLNGNIEKIEKIRGVKNVGELIDLVNRFRKK